MPQLSLYLDDETMELLRERSARSQDSMSKYVAKLIQRDDACVGWPQGYWEKVYGSLDDPTFVVPDEINAPLDELVVFG